MDLNDPRVMNLSEVSAAVGRREQQLRAAGLRLHAHALSYMLSSLAARDAPGDWQVLEALARECAKDTLTVSPTSLSDQALDGLTYHPEARVRVAARQELTRRGNPDPDQED